MLTACCTCTCTGPPGAPAGALLLADARLRLHTARHGRQLAMLAWGFAVRGLAPPPLLAALAELLKGQAHVVKLLDGADAVRVLWAAKRMGMGDGAALQRLSQRALSQVGDRCQAGVGGRVS